ncbi:MAG: hypothetical protein Q9208_005745 [Pyrenodesmia sp. 3 TL-2023]
MPTTRHRAALRRAEGLPPSPQNEAALPRELREPQRRKKKVQRSTRSTRSTATPDSEEDPASQQNQEVPAQTLREGNAGGYIRENTSEQQDFLPEPQSQSSELQQEQSDVAQEHGSSDEATAVIPEISGSRSVQSVQTPTHFPGLPNLSRKTQPRSVPSIFREVLSRTSPQAHVSPTHSAVEQVTAAVSVSTQTDGQHAAAVSPLPIAISPAHTRPSVHTAATQTSPIIPRASPKHIISSTRTISTQTVAPADKFRPLSLYNFRSELAVPPQSCTMTLCIGNEKEIRISKVPSAALDRIKEILHDRNLVFERNWLTREEAAAESAAAAAVAAQEIEANGKQPQSSAKRKRDDTNDITPSARRRRIEPAHSPTPAPQLSPNPFRERSFMRRKGRLGRSLAGRSQTATPLRPESSSTDAPATTDSTVRYGRDGTLRLLGAPHHDPHRNGSAGEGSAAVAATPGNNSDDEGDSESILEWTEGPYWSSNRNPTNQAVNSSNLPAATDAEPSPRVLQDTSPGASEQTLLEEPATPSAGPSQQSGWRLGSIFTTARRLIPGIRQRQAPVEAPQTIRPTARTQVSVDSHSPEPSQRGAQTEPRRQDQRPDQASIEPTSSFAQRLRGSQSITQKTFRTKENIEEIKRVKMEKEKIRAEWAKLDEERKITEQERKDVEDAHRAAYASQQPGSKRSLRPTPRVIPNPKGVSYGLDPAYFESSDEDEEEPTEATPSRTRPMRKARRLHGPDQSRIGQDGKLNDQDNLFSKSIRTSSNDQALQYLGSHFSESPPNAFEVSAAHSEAGEQVRENLKSTSSEDDNFNHSGHFQVPISPTSSEEDESEVVSQEPRQDTTQGTPLTESSVSSSGKRPSSAAQDTVTRDSSTQDTTVTPAAATSSARDSEVMKAPATPAQKPRSLDASKTLEQNRQLLRDRMAAVQSGKLVPSPQNSPEKAQVAKPILQAPTSQAGAPRLSSVAQHEESSKSRAPVEESLFVEPATAAAKDDFSILGAADRATSESPYLFVDTLPPEISELHAYQDYQAKMDTTVKEFVESTWEARDDEEAASAFNSAFAEFFDPEQAEKEAQASSATQNAGDEEPFVDNPDDDESSFYSDEEERISGDQLLSEILSTSTGTFVMDPAVSTFLDSQWTPEHEASAGDDFKKSWFAYEGLDTGGAEVGPATT